MPKQKPLTEAYENELFKMWKKLEDMIEQEITIPKKFLKQLEEDTGNVWNKISSRRRELEQSRANWKRRWQDEKISKEHWKRRFLEIKKEVEALK